MGRAAGVARTVARLGLNLLLPPRCLSCGSLVLQGGALCQPCWQQIAFLAPPHCAVCALPFEFESGPEVLCGSCARRRPGYRRARYVMRYDDASRRLLLAFKHADRTDAAAGFGHWLARSGQELIAEADFLAPVPLHWWRLFTRRYNQSALLAHALSGVCGLASVPDLLIRKRHTPPQGRKSAAARRRNVAGAFMVKAVHRGRLAGARVLLIDDVVTTGATAEACATALLRGGAAAVDVLALARVFRDETNTIGESGGFGFTEDRS